MSGTDREKGGWPFEELPKGWCWAPLDLVFDNVTSSDKKLKQKQYLQEGSLAVVDQGQELVGGYTNDESLAYKGELPVVIFGDHTRCAKFIDFYFAQGADGVKVLRPTPLVDPKFSHKSLLALELPDKGYSRHFKFLKATKFPVPPLHEQKRIADRIDALQDRSRRARAALEAARPLLDDLRRSVLAAAFRGDLTADWRRENPDTEPATELLKRIHQERRRKWEEAELAKMRAKGKDPQDDKWKQKYSEPEPVDTSGLPGLPKGWCWVRLSELGEMARGKSKHRPRNDPQLFGGEYPFLQTGEVAQANGQITEAKKYYSDFGLAQSRLFPVGTVCITIAANIADTAILGIEACFPDSVVGVIVDKQLLSPSYLETYIRTIRADLAAFAPATAQKNINLAILNEVVVPIPPEEELAEVDKKIQKALLLADNAQKEVTAGHAKLAAQEQAILAKAFRGELVPQDTADEPASVLLERIKAAREAQKPKNGKRK